jgi:eukaryotic-like serine/threonine-protein kinase
MNQTPSLIGEKLGSYRIESLLGSGAMGVVYRGTDEKRGRVVAVKVVHAELAQGSKVQERFKREFDILDQFRHPGIVRNLGYGKYRGTLYIAMEFIQGLTLDTILESRGALPWREVVDLGIQICQALQYAHERQVVHRDLKPSNLMVTEDGKVKLTDFGIAKDLDKTALTATGRTLGTAAYMAPEQIRGAPAVSHKTDLYALGAVLYQMLTGKPPFEGNTAIVLMHCHMNEPPPRPSEKIQEIPRALDDLVVGLMAKQPTDRPWDAAAVEVILTELRAKAERGAAIGMVWPAPGSAAAKSRGGDAAGAGRPDSTLTDRPKRKPRKLGMFATLASAVFATRYRQNAGDSDSPGPYRGVLEIAGLVTALMAVGGLIVYLAWPAGQEALYHKAEALMASTHRSDWLTARDEYLEQLDRRFPQNPYRDQAAKWRDKILLDEAEGRANILAAPVKTRLNEPNTNAERQFKISNEVVTQASNRHDDLEALKQWRAMAGALKPDDPEERPWYLLALRRAEQLAAAIQDRREFVMKQLQIADEAIHTGHPDQATTIRSKLIEQYANYTDLADIFRPAPAPVQPAPEPKPSGEATPAAPASSEPVPAPPKELAPPRASAPP